MFSETIWISLAGSILYQNSIRQPGIPSTTPEVPGVLLQTFPMLPPPISSPFDFHRSFRCLLSQNLSTKALDLEISTVNIHVAGGRTQHKSISRVSSEIPLVLGFCCCVLTLLN